MTGLPARRIQLVAQSNPDADWTARLALGGAAGFTLLLFAFGLILYQSWPQLSGERRSIALLTDRTERIANGQEGLSRDIASLRTDLRQDRTDRATGASEVALLRARVSDLNTTMASLRAQTDKLEAAGAGGTQAVPSPAAQPDPAVAEIRERLDALQRRLEQMAALPTPPAPPAPTPHAPLPPSTPRAVTEVAAAKPTPAPASPAYPVDEIEREVRDMQSVINQQRARASTARASAPTSPAPLPSSTPSPAPSRTSGIADPLAPITSKTPPRVATSRPGVTSMAAPKAGSGPAPSVSRISSIPSAPSAQQTVKTPVSTSTLEPRVSRVGVNSAMSAIGPLGLPFDAIGNLVVAIGEGLDHLFTGREYVPRPTPGDEPSTARAAR